MFVLSKKIFEFIELEILTFLKMTHIMTRISYFELLLQESDATILPLFSRYLDI